MCNKSANPRLTSVAMCAIAHALTIVVLLSLGGCEFYGDKQRTWTEDVVLDDGTQLRIRRRVEFTDYNSLAGDAYGAIETAATLELLGDRFAVPIWSVPLMPLVLYRDVSGEWVIVATSTDCVVWGRRGRPEPAYWEFRATQGGNEWREVPLSAASMGRPTNLFFMYGEGVTRHVTTEDKFRLQSDSTIAELYRSINPNPRSFNCM